MGHGIEIINFQNPEGDTSVYIPDIRWDGQSPFEPAKDTESVVLNSLEDKKSALANFLKGKLTPFGLIHSIFTNETAFPPKSDRESHSIPNLRLLRQTLLLKLLHSRRKRGRLDIPPLVRLRDLLQRSVRAESAHYAAQPVQDLRQVLQGPAQDDATKQGVAALNGQLRATRESLPWFQRMELADPVSQVILTFVTIFPAL